MSDQQPTLIPEEAEIKKKRDLKIELALFLVLGFLLGIVIKTEASKRITIGFEDHKAPINKQSYSISQIQKKLAEKAKEERAKNEEANGGSGGEAAPSAVVPAGGTCGQ